MIHSKEYNSCNFSKFSKSSEFEKYISIGNHDMHASIQRAPSIFLFLRASPYKYGLWAKKWCTFARHHCIIVMKV